ncbi:MAG TPA: polysaccharide deacetylase family protein [Rhizomicrobium sp.]|jgi:peptidoglycan/xylan/chitin deacetylase (PgdA/CDA1 family)|nr:polysaccharide deacetylase family protein [Rhizomicrobium sp.]
MDLKLRLDGLISRAIQVKPVLLRGARAVASITFDDFPKSAWVQGGPVLERRGVRGTYYTAGVFCGRTEDGTVFYDKQDLLALAAEGHEIGCHSFGHRSSPKLSAGALAEDFRRNGEFLEDVLGGPSLESFAFPFGHASVTTKRFYADRFSSVRGVRYGVNEGQVDLAQLRVVPLEIRRWNQKRIDAAIERAVQSRGWLIFYTHDVSESPSPYGSTPAMLDWALARAAATMQILPVREALPVALGN